MKRLTALCLTLSLASLSQADDVSPHKWPRFRGPGGRGVAIDSGNFPVNFGPAKKVLWKTSLPEGFSSPCIWGNRIFLTAYQPKQEKLETICLDRRTGAILWRRTAPAKKIERVYKVNSPASSTPTTDGQRVYVSIGSYGLLCYDFDSKEIWKKPLPRPRSSFGTATSPVLVGDLLLLNGQGNDRHLVAFNKNDGSTVWGTETPFPSDYPSPLLWKHGDRTEVIIPGRGGLLAFDLKGEKQWWVPGTSPEVAASPTSGGGLLFVTSFLPGGDPDTRMKLPTWEVLIKHDSDKDSKISRKEMPKDRLIFSRGGKEGIGDLHIHQMFWLYDRNNDRFVDEKEWALMFTRPRTNSVFAIKPGGKRDISDTHVGWKSRRGVPEVPSAIFYDDRLFLVSNGGVLTCLDAKTGKILKRLRLGAAGLYYSSPVIGDGKLYACSDAGIVTVVDVSKPEVKILGQNDLGEVIRATPALVDGKIYLRTASRLYAFGG